MHAGSTGSATLAAQYYNGRQMAVKWPSNVTRWSPASNNLFSNNLISNILNL